MHGVGNEVWGCPSGEGPLEMTGSSEDKHTHCLAQKALPLGHNSPLLQLLLKYLRNAQEQGGPWRGIVQGCLPVLTYSTVLWALPGELMRRQSGGNPLQIESHIAKASPNLAYVVLGPNQGLLAY